MKYIINEGQYGRLIYESGGCVMPEGSFADGIRKGLIDDFFNCVKIDSECNIDEPEYYDLLDPDMGYDYQTYIQNDLVNNRFIFYEGFSSYCWKSFMKQKQYEGMNKSEIIESFINNRGINLGKDYGFELEDYSYEKYDIGEFYDYILIMRFVNIYK